MGFLATLGMTTTPSVGKGFLAALGMTTTPPVGKGFLAALGMTTRRLVIEPVEMPPHFPPLPYSQIVRPFPPQRGLPSITPQTNF
ncbi:MAG: hypothetical protein LBI45_06820 [Bacteroidales bacterium]|nr:hypothetical protein [Bacteroidales bacterium]